MRPFCSDVLERSVGPSRVPVHAWCSVASASAFAKAHRTVQECGRAGPLSIPSQTLRATGATVCIAALEQHSVRHLTGAAALQGVLLNGVH